MVDGHIRANSLLQTIDIFVKIGTIRSRSREITPLSEPTRRSGHCLQEGLAQWRVPVMTSSFDGKPPNRGLVQSESGVPLGVMDVCCTTNRFAIMSVLHFRQRRGRAPGVTRLR